MNRLLSNTLSIFRSLSRRKSYVDGTSLITVALITAEALEALKDQLVELQKDIAKASPKLLPTPTISLNNYEQQIAALINEANRLRRLY